ncbi:unnamed protein product [Nesidiocoris tenuis]|nr:unnamed protein product [Nesidiocoris tenuis]
MKMPPFNIRPACLRADHSGEGGRTRFWSRFFAKFVPGHLVQFHQNVEHRDQHKMQRVCQYVRRKVFIIITLLHTAYLVSIMYTSQGTPERSVCYSEKGVRSSRDKHFSSRKLKKGDGPATPAHPVCTRSNAPGTWNKPRSRRRVLISCQKKRYRMPVHYTSRSSYTRLQPPSVTHPTVQKVTS